MKVTITKLLADNLLSLNWRNNELVDWVSGGVVYKLTGEIKKPYYCGFGYRFDEAVTSKNGVYSVIYERLGTKALLLKEGKLLREINRSYYCADVYEYPAAFIELPNGKTILAHCPKTYGRIDFEDVESGEILTDIPERDPVGFFHSRFKVSDSGKGLLSRGWVWQPLDFVRLYDVEDCLNNPLLLDKYGLIPDSSTEVCAGDFITDNLILLGTSDEVSRNYGDEDYDEDEDLLPPKTIGVWDTTTEKIITKFKTADKGLNLIVINETYAWDVYRYPKLINIKTGEIEASYQDIDCGECYSSIIHHCIDNMPNITFSKALRALAIGFKGEIYVLQFEE